MAGKSVTTLMHKQLSSHNINTWLKTSCFTVPTNSQLLPIQSTCFLFSPNSYFLGKNEIITFSPFWPTLFTIEKLLHFPCTLQTSLKTKLKIYFLLTWASFLPPPTSGTWNGEDFIQRGCSPKSERGNFCKHNLSWREGGGSGKRG